MSSENEETPLLSGPSTDSSLTKFRRAVGIDIENDDLEAARSTARGLYKQVIQIQLWRNRQYHLIESIFYFCLGTQIVLGACLAALGPFSSSHGRAITVLGVINSSLAGILALLKGQNLPDRLRKDRFEMRKVQDYIEETEIRLQAIEGREECDELELELDKHLQIVFAMYNAARDTAELNRPMSYAHQPVGDVQERAKAGSKRNLVAGNGAGKGKETGLHYEIS